MNEEVETTEEVKTIVPTPDAIRFFPAFPIPGEDIIGRAQRAAVFFAELFRIKGGEYEYIIKEIRVTIGNSNKLLVTLKEGSLDECVYRWVSMDGGVEYGYASVASKAKTQTETETVMERLII